MHTEKKRLLTSMMLSLSLWSYNAFGQIQKISNQVVAQQLIEAWSSSGSGLDIQNLNSTCIDVNSAFTELNQNADGSYFFKASTFNDFISQNQQNNTYQIYNFNEGLYFIEFDQPIQLKSNTAILGKGIDKTTFKAINFSNKKNLFEAINVQSAMMSCIFIDNSEMFDQQLHNQQNLEQDVQNSSVIYLSNAEHCKLKNLKINFGLGCHILLNNSAYNTIEHSEFKEAWIHGSHLGGTQGYGIAFSGSQAAYSHHNLIQHNVLQDLRHAIVVQYHAKQNVMAYNYTRYSYAYNYSFGIQLPWASSDVVLHGNGPSENLLEANYMQGNPLSNEGLINFNEIKALSVDNVKSVGNGPKNLIYRNYAPSKIVVQSNLSDCSYNQNQLLFANIASEFDINGSAHALFWNKDFNLNDLQFSSTLCLNPSENTASQVSAPGENLMGYSAYLNQIPSWMDGSNALNFNFNSSNYQHPAKLKFEQGTPLYPSEECSCAFLTTSDQKIKTQNTFSAQVFVINQALEIKLNQPTGFAGKFFVRKIDGAQVATADFQKNATTLNLSIPSLSSGVYLLQFVFENGAQKSIKYIL